MKTKEILQRSNELDWDDEAIWDYTAIERRAQEMRAEATWALFGALRERIGKIFRTARTKAEKARAATPATLGRGGHQPV